MSHLISPARASRWEWAQAALLAANVGWTTLCLGGYRAETMVVTSALTAALWAVHFLSRAVGGSAMRRPHPAGGLLLPFLAYAAANVLWVTPVRWLGWFDWFGWAQLIMVFWVVLNGISSRGPRRCLFGALVVVALISVACGCYQRFVKPDWLMLGRLQAGQFIGRASGSFGIPNSLAALLLLLLPATGALTLRRRAGPAERVWWGWATAVLALGLVLTISRGAWIGLALALTAWPLASRRWAWRRRLGIAMATLAAIAGSVAVLMMASPKVHARFVALVHDAGETTRPVMWRAAWKLFESHPVWGGGAGSYNVLFERHRPERFASEPQWTHNDYLNTLSDYGTIGFGLFFGAAAVITVACFRRRRMNDAMNSTAAGEHPPRGWLEAPGTVAALAIGLLAFALQLFVDFHFKIPALAMAFAIVAGLVVAETWPAKSVTTANAGRSRTAQIFAGFAALAGVVAVVTDFLPAYRAEAWRNRGRETIDQLASQPTDTPDFQIRLESAQSALDTAVALDPSNAQAWSDRSYAIALRGLVEKGRNAAWGKEAELAADRALALSGASYEFWVRRGGARDMQGRWLDAGNDFAKALDVAPNNSYAWYYYADHLYRNSAERALADAALAFCLRLDPGNQPGLALRQRLAISPQLP